MLLFNSYNTQVTKALAKDVLLQLVTTQDGDMLICKDVSCDISGSCCNKCKLQMLTELQKTNSLAVLIQP